MVGHYDSLDAVNFSTLKAFASSPLHYKAALSTPRTETPALRIGRLFHAQVLEPDTVDDEFVMYVGRRAGVAWDDFKEEHAAKTILSSKEWQAATSCAVAALSSPLARTHLDKPGKSEFALEWWDEKTGIQMKGRIDRYGGGRLVDLKSTRSIEPEAFNRSFATLHYHAQLAIYEDGLRAAGYDIDGPPIIIAVENTEPFDVVTHEVPKHVVDEGRHTYRRWLKELAECREKDSWPGVARGQLLVLEIPDWAYRATLDETPPLNWEGVA